VKPCWATWGASKSSGVGRLVRLEAGEARGANNSRAESATPMQQIARACVKPFCRLRIRKRGAELLGKNLTRKAATRVDRPFSQRVHSQIRFKSYRRCSHR
jgi:hypothetical protein